mmetsp:Transcript_121775/g.224440  ORF Transcript_121775/g.224440 Transcript_121775/m.224440 type:complete len:211 (-) Transcript_121775:318-950(-)
MVVCLWSQIPHFRNPAHVCDSRHLTLKFRRHLPQEVAVSFCLVQLFGLQEKAAQVPLHLGLEVVVPHHDVQLVHGLLERRPRWVKVADDAHDLPHAVCPKHTTEALEYDHENILNGLLWANVPIANGCDRHDCEMQRCQVQVQRISNNLHSKGFRILQSVDPGVSLDRQANESPTATYPVCTNDQHHHKLQHALKRIWYSKAGLPARQNP